MQVPGPELAKELGVVGYLLIVVVLSGVGTIAWFLRRMAGAMDRLAAGPELLTQIVEKLEHLEDKMDEAISLARLHADAAKLWAKTELPGRIMRGE